MLVLTRRPHHDTDDTLILHDKRTGDTYQVIVTEVRGDQVRLGITAPRTVPVHRGEVYDEIALETGAMMATARLLGELDAPGSSLDRDEWMGPFPEE